MTIPQGWHNETDDSLYRIMYLIKSITFHLMAYCDKIIVDRLDVDNKSFFSVGGRDIWGNTCRNQISKKSSKLHPFSDI